jgi:hypothetical protein
MALFSHVGLYFWRQIRKPILGGADFLTAYINKMTASINRVCEVIIFYASINKMTASINCLAFSDTITLAPFTTTS